MTCTASMSGVATLRIARSSSSPTAGSPVHANRTVSVVRPRSGSGKSGRSGSCMNATDVVPSSGSRVHQRLHVRRTAEASAPSNHRAPAYSSACSTRSISTAVTMPRVPLPPRRPQNRSGCGLGGDATQHAVAGDDVERADGVGRQAVGAGDRAETAAGEEADDADVGRRAAQAREVVRRTGLQDPLPLHAGADARPALLGVDGDLVEQVRVHEDRVVHPLGGAVAGALHGDADAERGREAQGPADVVGVARLDDGERADRLGEVARPGQRLVGAGAGQVHALDDVREGADGGGGVGREVVRAEGQAERGHGGVVSLFWLGGSGARPVGAHGSRRDDGVAPDTSGWRRISSA